MALRRIEKEFVKLAKATRKRVSASRPRYSEKILTQHRLLYRTE
jgi:hypothetical protein